MTRNVYWHDTKVDRELREKLNGHPGACLWFTGLSGSGKSTLAAEVEYALHQKKIRTYLLDGDNVRHGLNKDLGFSERERNENIRRVGEVAALMVDAGLVVLATFISPYRNDREAVRGLMPEGRFIEVFVDSDLEACEARDPKGLYKKARRGEIADFTGITAPYEKPAQPELTVFNGSGADLQENVQAILDYLEKEIFITPLQ